MTQESPHNVEAERAVIGSALVYGEEAVNESEALRSDEFFIPHHRDAWTEIVKLAQAGEATDAITVGARVRAAGSDGRFPDGWQTWALGCAACAHVPQQVGHYAQMVRELAASRRLIESCTLAINMARSGRPFEEQATFIRDASADIETMGARSGTVHVSEAIQLAVDEVEQQQRGIKVPRVYTGIEAVDAVMGGAELGNLVLVAARPGIGKSAFVGNVAANCGLRGVPGWFGSAEMMNKQLGRRWLSGEARIDSNKLKRGDVDIDEWKKIGQAAERMRGASLWVNDRVTKLDQLLGESRRWHAKHVAPMFAKSGKEDDRRAIVVADYAQRIQVGRAKGDTREQEVAKIPVALKTLAKQLPVVVFLVVMLGREAEKRGGDPMLSDLRESGAFEQEADVVLFLTHDDENGDRVIIAKNREGETGAAKCRWDPAITRWSSLVEDNPTGPEPRRHYTDLGDEP